MDCMDFWLSRLSPRYGYMSKNILLNWFDWLREGDNPLSHLSLEGLVRYQKDASGDSKFDILNHLQMYLVEHPDWRVSYKKRIYTSVRSFFLHNRAELPRDRSFIFRSDKRPYIGDISVEEFKRILSSCNLMYRAIFLCMFQGAMGIGEWDYWNKNGWSSLRSQLENRLNPIKVDLPGRKMNRNVKPYYTFIGGDAIKALRDWLPHRSKGYESIFVSQIGTELGEGGVRMYWFRHLEKLGLIHKVDAVDMGNEKYSIRYEKNPHELRDLFRTRWQKSGRAPEVAEFFMGHQIDPLGYNKAMGDQRYTKMEYRRAEKWLNILSQDPEHIHVDEVEEKVSKDIESLWQALESQGKLIQRLMERAKS